MKVTLSPLKRSLKILKGSLGSLTWDSWLVMSRHLAVNKLNCICQFEQWKETCFVCLCGSIIQPGSKQGLSWIYAPLFPRDYDIAQFWQSRVLKKPKHFFFLWWRHLYHDLATFFFPTDNWFLGPPPWGTTQRVDEIIYDGRSTYPTHVPPRPVPQKVAGGPLWHKGFWTPFLVSLMVRPAMKKTLGR